MLKYKTVRTARSENMSVGERLSRMSIPLLALMFLIIGMGLVMQYSVGGGDFARYALPQLLRVIFGLGVFFIVALSNVKIWIRSTYLFYATILILIILVYFAGYTGMGAQRWINFGFFTIQPSELIKIAMVMVMARYFAWMNSGQMMQIKNFIIPTILFAVPFVFIIMQPDLGTALSLAIIVASMFFIVGANRNWFFIGIIIGIISAPILWHTVLLDYQRTRIITFMDPTKDMRGAGYQINQARIAFGSGGLTGKGFVQGTQTQQQFLPEKHTDFIWTVVGEEFGFVGALGLLGVFYAILVLLYNMSKSCRSRYSQLLIFGFGINWFVYFFTNIGMNMGLIPTVGVPLPLFSFGGSAMLALLLGFGLVQNCWIHRDLQLPAKGW